MKIQTTKVVQALQF